MIDLHFASSVTAQAAINVKISEYKWDSLCLLWYVQNDETPNWTHHVSGGTWDDYLHPAGSTAVRELPKQDQLILAQLILMSQRSFPYERFF